MTTHAIGTLEDFAQGEAKKVTIDDRTLVVVRIEDSVYVLDDRCSHGNYSLAEGDVDVTTCSIECAKHGALFSLKTGEAESFPATKPVRHYDVINSNGTLEVVIS
jgi:3-phenylpropionate/trans-cinnamate dioxygenase ferredoxin subunit